MKKPLVTVLIILIVVQPAIACLWDYDTLAMERRKFPGTLELITGKFLRHSEAYYQWRIQDREERRKSDPDDPKLLDDLSVAYDKTGNRERAIELALESKEKNPDRYETAANLGTFYIHAGELEKGLYEIKRALVINPEAHFGREEYQMLLVEYLLERKRLKSAGELKARRLLTFPKFILEQKFKTTKPTAEEKEQEIQSAIKGITGMMRFGNHDSPVLLEALGELLLSRATGDSSHRLACRALLKASYEADDPEEQKRLRMAAQMSLGWQTAMPNEDKRIPLVLVESSFKDELAEADHWYQQVCDDEQRWIEEGKNVDAEFSKKYYEQPSLTETEEPMMISRTVLFLTGVFGLLAVWWVAKVMFRMAAKPVLKKAA